MGNYPHFPPFLHHQVKKNIIRIILFICILSLSLIFLLRYLFTFSRADFQSSSVMVEPEKGTITGQVSIKSDSNASGGSYISFDSSTSSDPTFQPKAPYYATFFYLWYQNPQKDGAYSYWNDNGNKPPTSWFSHYLPDINPQVFDPTNELYSAKDYPTFKWQAAKLKEAKQEVAIASWWGQGRKEDMAFNAIVNDFMARTDNPYPNLRWTIYYEREYDNPDVSGVTPNDPTPREIADDLEYIYTSYAKKPYYLKINNNPVIFVYSDSTDIPGTMHTRWKDAINLVQSETGIRFYYVLKVFPGFANITPQPDSWHQYAPASRSDQQGPYSYVSPGFWLNTDELKSTERLSRDAAAFEQAVTNMVSSNATWKLVETWNEWGEGTSVEPGVQTIKGSDGVEREDTAGYPFKNLYIDILNRNLPSLE